MRLRPRTELIGGCLWLLGAGGHPAVAGEPTVLVAPLGHPSGSSFGEQSSLSVPGGVNGDGYGDFAVGAPTWDATEFAHAGRCRAYFGGLEPDTIADLVLDHFGSNLFGGVVHGLGDFNGDRFGDFLVGAWGGGHGVYLGGPLPSSTPWVKTWVYPGSCLDFPRHSVPIGDVNPHGYDDLIISDYQSDELGPRAGRAYLVLGGPSPDLAVVVSLGSYGPGVLHFGLSVTGEGVVNADGYDDVIVSNPFFDGLYLEEGRLDVYRGGAVMDSLADAVLPGGGSDSEVGRDLRESAIVSVPQEPGLPPRRLMVPGARVHESASFRSRLAPRPYGGGGRRGGPAPARGRIGWNSRSSGGVHPPGSPPLTGLDEAEARDSRYYEGAALTRRCSACVFRFVARG